MSEDKSAETNSSRSFEDRVFARFDALDARFDRIETRLDRLEVKVEGVEMRLEKVESRLNSLDERVEKLEAKQYDTKPIWERALSEIAMLRTEVQAGFEQVRTEMDDKFKKTADQIDVLNRNVLEVRADLRYFDRRITKLESEQLKTS